MYKVIIFDFFGVIRSDQYQSWLSRHGYKRTGGFAEVSHLADIGQLSMAQYYQGLHELSQLPTSSIESEFKTYADLDAHLISLIKRLKPNYQIGLLSNSNGPHLRSILAHNDLTPLFDLIVISGEIGLAKPSAEIFRYTLQQAGTKPEETIFIDDNRDNVEAARAMGIISLWYQDYPTLMADLDKLNLHY